MHVISRFDSLIVEITKKRAREYRISIKNMDEDVIQDDPTLKDTEIVKELGDGTECNHEEQEIQLKVKENELENVNTVSDVDMVDDASDKKTCNTNQQELVQSINNNDKSCAVSFEEEGGIEKEQHITKDNTQINDDNYSIECSVEEMSAEGNVDVEE